MALLSLGLTEATRGSMPSGDALELRHDPFDSPIEPLNSPANWSWFYGGLPTASGELISEHNVLTVSAVYACVSYIASSIATLPLELWEVSANGRMKATDHMLWGLLTNEPNPEMTAVTWLEAVALSLALFGNSYCEIERNGMFQPVALWPLDARKTKPVRTPNNVIVYQTTDGFHSEGNEKSRTILAEDMLHVPLFSFDGLKGISPVAAARETFGLAKALEKHGSRYIANGSNAQGLLVNKSMTKPDPKQLKEWQDSWQSAHAGMNAGKMGFLGGDWDFKNTGQTNTDAQFLLSREFQREEIASIFHIDSSLLWNKGKANATSSEQIGIRFVTDTLRPYLSRIEAEIKRKLLPQLGRKAGMYEVKFDASERQRGDFKSQQEGYAAGRQWGWYSANDIRRELGENPGGPELDIYVIPVNLQNAKRLLDTESIQDQPVDADPDADAAPTDAERSMMGSYRTGYLKLFRDAYSRLMRRSKRDSEAISSIFRPILESIADLAVTNRDFDFSTKTDAISDGIVSDALKGMARRAAKLPEVIAPSDFDTYALPEFTKVVRSIHIEIFRDIAAAKAASELDAAA